MEHTARLFNCILCHKQVRICSNCDRGNIYCGHACSASARQKSVRAAGARYQKSYQGKLNHAARQQRYRERQKQIVTHQCSKPEPVKPSSKTPDKCMLPGLTTSKSEPHCDFCDCHVTDLLRINFIDRGLRTKVVVKTSYAQGP